MPAQKKRTRVMIIDDHELVRNGLESLVANTEDLEACGQAAAPLEGMRMLRQVSADVVCLDLMLNGRISLHLIRRIKNHYPQIQILIMSMYNESLYGQRVLKIGASGYVCKQDPAHTLLEGIRQIRNGGLYFSDATLRQVTHSAEGKLANQNPVLTLTNRELEVFNAIGHGKNTAEIATALHLSHSTVHTYRERLKNKLGATNSTELTHRAINWMRDAQAPAVARKTRK